MKFNIKFILVYFLLISFINLWFAENICENTNNRFIVKWSSDIITQQIAEYHVVDTWNQNGMINAKFSIFDGDVKINTSSWESFNFSSDSWWTYLLVSEVELDDCTYKIKTNINIYNKSIVYIWDNLDDFQLWYEENFRDHGILFTKIISNSNVFSENELKEELIKQNTYIDNASIIIINNKDLEYIFQILSKLDETNELNLSNKTIFIVNNTNKHFVKRTLSKYSNILDNEDKYMIDSSDLIALISNLSFDKDVLGERLVEVFPLSFEWKSRWLFLSYFIDNLIANWIPINLIWLLLTLTLAALVVTAFRQIIWFSVFWTFSPLLFGLSIAVLWTKTSIIFFVIAIIATLITRLITKRLYLLNSAKLSLLLGVYFLTTILILGLDSALNLNILWYQIFSNTYVIFPILFLIFATDKVFWEWYKLFSKQQIVSLIEFVVISIVVVLIINSVWLRLILLSYPEIIILLLIAIIIVWRFTWLQLFEYFRFSPILKWEWDEEEEEE